MGWNIKKTFKKVLKNMDPIRQTKKLTDTIVNKTEDVLGWVSGKKQMEMQNDANLQAWNMQNEYNTPAAQMQRLKDAGLNPNLAYGSVDTGNAKSAPDIGNVADPVARFGSIFSHAFNAVQLLNSLKATNANIANQQASAQHNADVLRFNMRQAEISNALRVQSMAYNQTRDKYEYDKWMKEFDERVRHNMAMEGKPSTMGILDNAVYGATGRHATDVARDPGRMVRKFTNKLVGTVAGIPLQAAAQIKGRLKYGTGKPKGDFGASMSKGRYF